MPKDVLDLPDASWRARLAGDPLPWLLDASDPAVRAATLTRLLDRPHDDPEVARARRRPMRVDPIAAILAARHADGWWEKPGPGYGPKYTGTVWQLIFLDQLGACGLAAHLQPSPQLTALGGFPPVSRVTYLPASHSWSANLADTSQEEMTIDTCATLFWTGSSIRKEAFGLVLSSSSIL